MTKLCKDCKYFREPRFKLGTGDDYDWAKCAKHPDPVSGEGTAYCKEQREYGLIAATLMPACGKRGRWWEPK